jgi:hypothetical protein
MKYVVVTILILAVMLAPAAIAQEIKIASYGFYGGVDNNNNPVNPATVVVDGTSIGFFTTANPYAYFYIVFDSISAPFELVFQWVDPNGEKINIPITNSQPGVFTSYWAWSRIALNENRTLGLWTLNLYYNGEKILEEPLFLQTPANIVDRLNELTSENERLSSQLETATRQLDELKTRFNQQESELSTLRMDLKAAQDENNALKNSLQQTKDENIELKEKLASETARLGGLEQQRVIFIITTGIMAAVAAVIAAVSRRGRTPLSVQSIPISQTTSQASTQLNYCPSCGTPLQYVPQYQKYWCPNEQKYI